MSGSKIPSLINGSAGYPAIASAGKKCKCKGCGAWINMGDKCYDIPNPRAAFSNARRFCPSCFNTVLTKTKSDIALLEAM